MKFSFFFFHSTLTPLGFRVRDKLASGTMAVAGDQWPIFVYEKREYDESEPWSGLFRGTILVTVMFILYNLLLHGFHSYLTVFRVLSTYSPLLVPSKMTARPRDRETHGYMV